MSAISIAQAKDFVLRYMLSTGKDVIPLSAIEKKFASDFAIKDIDLKALMLELILEAFVIKKNFEYDAFALTPAGELFARTKSFYVLVKQKGVDEFKDFLSKSREKDIANRMLDLQREANQISSDSNKIARSARTVAIIAIVISVFSLLAMLIAIDLQK